MKSWLVLTLLHSCAIIFSSCKPAGSGMITGVNYEERSDETILTLVPYGGLKIPGKWKEVTYDAVSKQHFFESADRKTALAIAINPKDKYPFYQFSFSGQQFLEELYKWESEHFKKEGATTLLIEKPEGKNYLLWEANIKAEGIHQIYLYGLKENIVYNLRGSSKTWSDQQIKDFLVALFEK